ncbi:MAG: LysM peptidoglycan-binding domain-containing protein [Planctomycetota bacterium]
MGNFEKLVVLTVLFLSAIVLAVSLSADDQEGPGGPMAEAGGGEDRVARSQAASPPADPGRDFSLAAEGRRASDHDRSESATPIEPLERPSTPAVEDESAPAESAPAIPETGTAGRQRVLRTAQGLSASPLEDYMLYVADAGDTWSALADRFYRSGTYVPLLRAANEDLARPIEGETLLVPVYDFRVARSDRSPHEPAPAREPQPARPVQPEPAAQLDSYVVQGGDTLSDISQKVYGTASRWYDIFEANRDVMPDADTLGVGMTLRIP